MAKKIKVAYILSYKDPGYVRTRFLLDCLENIEHLALYRAINTTKGLLQYPQSLLKLIYIRFKYRPDVYILGFRGQEILWIVRLLTLGKPLIFDEFINLYLWAVEEHGIVKKGSITSKLLKKYSTFFMRRVQRVITDTKLNAIYSARANKVNLRQYRVIRVGADEKTFLLKGRHKKIDKNTFDVFFYGTMLPLHGVNHILEAAKILRNKPIKFNLVGGKGKDQSTVDIKTYVKKNELKNIQHKEWVKFEELPKLIENADLCLGGPFGNTPQARKVVTGKTTQFLFMSKPTIIGKIDEDVGMIDKYNCITVDQGSARSLARGIEWGWRNKDKLSIIGQRGKKLYDESFSVSKQTSIIRDLLLEVY